MEKTLGVTKARELLRKIGDAVKYQGEKYIIERDGEPAVAIVPLAIYQEWKRNRQELIATITAFQESSGDNDPDAMMELALEAQEAINKRQTTVAA